MSAEADAGPVRGLDGVGPGVAIFDKGVDEFVGEVRMRSAVACPLREAEMRFFAEVVNALGGEMANLFRQQFREVGRRNELGNFAFGEFRAMHDERFVFDERPFDGNFGAVNIDAFAILARCVEERAIDARGDVGVFEFDVRAFDGVRRIVFADEFRADGAGAEAGDVFGNESGETAGGPP